MSEIKHTRRKDFTSIGALCVILLILMYVLLGFWKAGLDAPYYYAGADEAIVAEQIKSLRVNGWILENDMLGAPFGENSMSIPARFTYNFDLCLQKLISCLFENPFKAINVFFLLIIPMCAISAFFVLRELGVKRVFALYGAMLFSCAPYIFARNIGHLPLTACYFVPLSILLCVWMMSDDQGYLKLDRNFFRYKKNIATVIFCFLIANNGLGYYAVFTCYLLVITALYKLGKHRNISAIKKPCIAIAMIGIFFAVNIIPYALYILNSGNPTGVVRSVTDGEFYGLKIAQFFIPTNSHGNETIEKLIQTYNSNMPLVNENADAYLGVGGIAGFILSLIVLVLGGRKSDKDSDILSFFSQLNIWAILLCTVGGFNSLLALAGFQFLRGTNRISIFVLYISICVLCICGQRLYERIKAHKARKTLEVVYGLSVLLFAVVSIFDILPTYGGNDAGLAKNEEIYMQDHRFILSIEDQMEDGDMIYQMPYHKFPEAGIQNEMYDYHLMLGYLHSDKLKWSYGVIKGSYGDTWQELVSQMPIRDRIETLVSTGYKGIYIDAKAFTMGELARLRQSIEDVIITEPILNERGDLLFYDLRSYISTHPEVASNQMPTLEELRLNYKRVFNPADLAVLGECDRPEDRDCLVIYPGSIQFGPYTELTSGKYRVVLHGSNLNMADYDTTCDGGLKQIGTVVIDRSNDLILYEFSLQDSAALVEFRTFNNSSENIELYNIEVEKI